MNSYFKSFLLVFTTCLALVFLAACAEPAEEGAQIKDILSRPEEFKSMHFYVGGGKIRRGDPHWTHDLKITFNGAGTAQLSRRIFGETCKKSGSLNRAEVDGMFDLLQTLKFKVNDEAVEDSGYSQIEITLDDDSKHIVHLRKFSADKGEPYATNGELAETHLADIDDSLGTLCR